MGLDHLLRSVTRPGRYVDREPNSIRKDHRRVDVRFAFAFPDVYEVGMSHLGGKILYHQLNMRPDVVMERVFAPWTDMESGMRGEGIPLFCLESRVPVKEFDIVGFSLQYELSYTNVLNMLDLAGIPLLQRERDSRAPLVLGGGPCAFNPEPVADFFDAFLLGDGEEAVHEIVNAYKAWKTGGRPGGRNGLLRQLSRIEGVYVPSFYRVEYFPDGRLKGIEPLQGAPEAVQRRVLSDLDDCEYPTRPVVPLIEVIHDRAMVEVFRGCTRGCRFCQAGMIYRPVRERRAKEVVRLARELVENTGYNEVSLTSLSTADYTHIRDVLESLLCQLGEGGVSVSLPSLRVDSFSLELAEKAQRVRRTGLTFAPEAGTERLRRVINKGLSDEDLINTARAAFSAGWDSLKLYFMIGLPGETDEDLDGIADLTRRVLATYHEVKGGRGRGRLKLTLSVSVFVPKAHTPFQWEPQLPIDEVRRRQGYLRSRLRSRNVVIDWHDAEQSLLEAVFARGDRRLGKPLYTAWRGGCRFDSWTEHFHFDRWQKAFAEHGLNMGFYATRARSYDEVLPWDHLSTGLDKHFLMAEHRRAHEGQTTVDCRQGQCSLCGACPELGVAVKLAD